MNKNLICLLLIMLFQMSCQQTTNLEKPDLIIPKEGPIQLHPENPHYFLYKGKTTALITSAEHYGAVINLDFDYKTYLKSLAGDGMNYTRIFTGTYFGRPGEYNSSLSPQKDRLVIPWEMVALDDRNSGKYDLSSVNKTFYGRLKDFVTTAAQYNIIVEVTLFSAVYGRKGWAINPQNPENNVNLPKGLEFKDVHTINNGKLWGYQRSFVEKIVTELNSFDNIFFEIQNEPWHDHNNNPVYNILNGEDLVENDWKTKVDFATNPSLEWQEDIAETIISTEDTLPKKHLIAQNYANYKATLPEVKPNIDIINFHYAWPEAAQWNYNYDKVIGFDESGFAGSEDKTYRRQAWRFLLSGGGLFNNLDYSYFVGHEDGTGINTAPGGGSKTLRTQLKILSKFLHSLELEKLHPDNSGIISSPGVIPYVLSDSESFYAMFLQAMGTSKTSLSAKVAAGNYKIVTLNTLTGETRIVETVKAENGILTLSVDIPDGELAIKISKVRK